MKLHQSSSLVKGESSTLDLGINWSDWLGTDTIISSEWINDPELIIFNTEEDEKTTSCYISGGVNGQSYRLFNKITTENGLIESRFVTISIRDLPV